MSDSTSGLYVFGFFILVISLGANAWLWVRLKKQLLLQAALTPPSEPEVETSPTPSPPEDDITVPLHQWAHDLRSPLALLNSLTDASLHPELSEPLRESIRVACLQLKELAYQADTVAEKPVTHLTEAELEGAPSPQTPPEAETEIPSHSSEAVPPPSYVAEERNSAKARKPRVRSMIRAEDEAPEVQLLEPILESVITRAQEKLGRFIQITWWSGNGFGIFVKLKRRAFSAELVKALEKVDPSYRHGLSLHVDQTSDKQLEITLRIQGQNLQTLKSLSIAGNPEWFSSDLHLPKDCQLIILDDDPSIHRLWAMRLQGAPCQVLHLRNPEDAIDWYQNNWNEGSNTFWLCDHDLGPDSRSGLETIELLGIQDESLLITSRFEDPEMQNRVVRQGVRILPKLLAPIAPISWVQRQDLMTPAGTLS